MQSETINTNRKSSNIYLSFAGQDVSVIFTPHLVPMTRGILSTIYVKLSSEYTTESLHKLMTSYYANQPFVRIRDIGTFPTTKEVLGSNTAISVSM